MPAPPGKIPPARGHIPVLDGLRGIAILLVVLHNVVGWQGTTHSLLEKAVYFALAPGWIGVQLFFALSGFLITGILLDSRGRPGALRAFWVRRALRIFPLYYAVTLAGAVVVPALLPLPAGMLAAVEQNRVYYFTYVSNWTDLRNGGIPYFPHFWSLAIEEQFYLVWPLAVMALDRRKLLRVAVGLAVLALLARAAMRLDGLPAGSAYEFTIARMDALTLGGAASVVLRDEALLVRVTPWLRRTLVLSAASLLVTWPFTRGFRVDDEFVQVVGYGVLSVFCVALVLEVVVRPGSTLARRLSAPWLRWLGKYSYAIYVLHYPIALVLAPRFTPTIATAPPLVSLATLFLFEAVVLGASVAGALVSWNVLERWALALKDRFAARPVPAG
jgi:peptidoglycan/LPS O-acetylase OafA/YrhL